MIEGLNESTEEERDGGEQIFLTQPTNERKEEGEQGEIGVGLEDIQYKLNAVETEVMIRKQGRGG